MADGIELPNRDDEWTQAWESQQRGSWDHEQMQAEFRKRLHKSDQGMDIPNAPGLWVRQQEFWFIERFGSSGLTAHRLGLDGWMERVGFLIHHLPRGEWFVASDNKKLRRDRDELLEGCKAALNEFRSIRPHIRIKNENGMISEQVLDQLQIAILRAEDE